MNRILIGLALVASAAAGCSDDASCTNDGDCFAGEVCTSGTCGQPSTNGQTGSNATTNSMANNVATDAGNNTNNTSNSSTNNATTGDAGTDAADEDAAMTQDMGSPAACIVDPFEVDACPDDGNDRFAERFEQSTVGCQNAGFVPLDLTRQFRMCAVEGADLFEVSMVECDNQTIRVEWVFRPLVSCDRELLNIEASVQGKRCSEQDQSTDIQCGWNENGEFVAQMLVRDMGSIASTRFELDTNMNSNVDFEYELTARVSQ